MKKINQIFQKCDPNSLRLRLTAGFAAFSFLGLGSLACWTGWRMQQILIEGHKKNLEKIATRVPHNVEMLNKMAPKEEVVSQVVDNLDTSNTLLWIENSDNQILAKSNTLTNSSESQENKLISLEDIPIKPKVVQVGNR